MEQTLGKRISANRKRLGMTQEQLAEKLGVTAQAVSKWENDQSCPDISILPRLAQLFGTSTDALLGCVESNPVVHEAQVVQEDKTEGLHIQNGNWNISWESGKHGALCFAVLVLAIGVLYLLAQVFYWDVTFWQITWPTALFVLGLFGLFREFSFINLGSALLGAFFLVSKLLPFELDIDGKVVFAVIVVLFGISLLIDALSKKRKSGIHFHSKNADAFKHTFQTDEDSFEFHAGFGEFTQNIELAVLDKGEIHCAFGEYCVDLSGVEAVSDTSTIEAQCSFGQLTLLVPRKYLVQPDSSTAFASVEISGQPDTLPIGTIQLDASVSFGQIVVQYI